VQAYWTGREDTVDMIRAEAEAEVKTSEFSDSRVDVKVGANKIFFSPREYGISGFSLTFSELCSLVKEARSMREKPRTIKRQFNRGYELAQAGHPLPRRPSEDCQAGYAAGTRVRDMRGGIPLG